MEAGRRHRHVGGDMPAGFQPDAVLLETRDFIGDDSHPPGADAFEKVAVGDHREALAPGR